MNRKILFTIIGFLLLNWGCSRQQNSSAYLFAYFLGNEPGEEAIRFAVSDDGFHYRALNNNNPIVDSKKISSTGGLRDPHIMRCADGKTFYMVATDLYVPEMGWKNYAMVLMKSVDLVHWESTVVNIPQVYPNEFGDVWRVWAPQTIYDEKAGKYMVYFSMKQGNDPDKLYYAYANKDFTGLEAAPKQLFVSPTNNACIDADIIQKDGQYHLFFKSEDGEPGIKLAISDKLYEGYKQVSQERVDQSTDPVEGSGIFKLNNSDGWILMYDLYTTGRYQFTRSTDLQNFTVIDQEITMNFHPRHGTVMPITRKELESLVEQFGSFDDLLVDATSTLLKKNNIEINNQERKIFLPIKNGTDIQHFDPMFKAFSGISITPKGNQDFSKGPVKYTVELKGKGTQEYLVTVEGNNNPVIEGYYADPEILYSEKTGKYYIYPTSDGFKNWEGTYFKVFSSSNLVDWDDEGICLDLRKDVSWAKRNAWAPAIIEKKINGTYKYFYYYSAAQKIGVATGDDPKGPFADSGKALIDSKPDGAAWGQQIDPDVFADPATGKNYLYWGNGYMAVAELNDDMMSIKTSTLKVITPPDYIEGTYVVYRDGVYYFFWSQGDTRKADYCVRYGMATSATGPISIPVNNVILSQNPSNGIYATGHNSILNIHGTDDWCMVYHRFTRPKGITMVGNYAGFYREVCIDKLQFNPDGTIEPVATTIEGISPLNDKKQLIKYHY